MHFGRRLERPGRLLVRRRMQLNSRSSLAVRDIARHCPEDPFQCVFAPGLVCGASAVTTAAATFPNCVIRVVHLVVHLCACLLQRGCALLRVP